MSTLPPVLTEYPTVEVRDDLLNGSPIVRGSRVPVRRLWSWHRKGVSVESLVKRYPVLGWEKVLGGLAFAYANEELIEADLDREREIIDEDLNKTAKVPTIPGVVLGRSKTTTTAQSGEESK